MGKIICPSCKKKIPDTSTVCPKCFLPVRKESKQQQASVEPFRNPLDIGSNPEHQAMLRAMFEKTGWYRVEETLKSPYRNKETTYKFIEGINLLEQMKLNEALNYYKKVIKNNANRVDLWNNLGVTLKALHDNNQAFKCYEQALKINPQYYIGWYNKGGLYFDLEMYEDAIESFNKALDFNPNCGEARNDKIVAEERLGIFSLDGMKESFDFMLSGHLLRANLNKGSALVDLGNGKDAIIGYSESFYKNAEEVNSLYKKGLSFLKKNQCKEALYYYEKAIKLNPEMAIVWYSKAQALRMLNNREEAFRCIKHALKLDPNLLYVWLFKGTFHLEDQQIEEAKSSFFECLRINPFDPNAKMLLRMIEL
ncbi:MAG: tetratricopeptide repeat protein [Candidatus Hermodarchaeota archaeon]